MTEENKLRQNLKRRQIGIGVPHRRTSTYKDGDMEKIKAAWKISQSWGSPSSKQLIETTSLTETELGHLWTDARKGKIEWLPVPEELTEKISPGRPKCNEWDPKNVKIMGKFYCEQIVREKLKGKELKKKKEKHATRMRETVARITNWIHNRKASRSNTFKPC